jgi:hypothetical protein
MIWDNTLNQPGQIAGLVVGVFANLLVFSLMPGNEQKMQTFSDPNDLRF